MTYTWWPGTFSMPMRPKCSGFTSPALDGLRYTRSKRMRGLNFEGISVLLLRKVSHVYSTSLRLPVATQTSFWPKKVSVKEVKGIPQKFGIFYALGFALIAEGFLSSCYHACPTNENFQYDSTFMYVIAALLILKIYQLRHRDTLSASTTFFGITYIIIINHCSIAEFKRVLYTFICGIL